MSILGESLRAFSDSRERYWWQSRHNLRDPPDLVNIPALARAIRA